MKNADNLEIFSKKMILTVYINFRDHILEKQSFSEPMRPADLNTPTHHTTSGTHTTVISVRGSNNGGIDNKSLAINIPEPTSQQQITVASAAEVGGGGIDSTGTKSATPVGGGGALEVDSESSLRTVTTNAATTPDYNNGDTASKQSSDGGQMSPNDRTSLLGPPHTVS